MKYGPPYPGFVFRWHKSDSSYHFLANKIRTNENERNYQNVNDINIKRENNKIYYNDAEITDFSDFSGYFNHSVWMGATPNASMEAMRYLKANLNDITIKVEYNNDEYSNLYSQLPTPTFTEKDFGGWYTKKRRFVNRKY